MNFHEIRFPTAVSFGASGGPERRTEIVALSNGYEERNTPWAHSRRRYEAGMGLRSLDDLQSVVAFFEARRAQLYGFRWKDWTDFKSCAASQEIGPEDQVIGTGDGANGVFQLSKRYGDGVAAYTRDISKPLAARVSVAVDGEAISAFTVDGATGQVVLQNVPAVGQVVTAGFEFDVPVRFDTDQISFSISSFNVGEIPEIPVIEVRV